MVIFMRDYKKESGFTLIELMIVVTIIGVMASIAIPNYLSYVCKSKQSEAKYHLDKLATLQSIYFAEHRIYATNLGNLGFGFRGETRYTYTIDSADSNGFSASATAVLGSETDIWTMDEQLTYINSQNGCN